MTPDFMAFVVIMALMVGGVFFASLQFIRRILELRHERLMHGQPESLLLERLDRIEAVVETTALEVERIAEANRFMSKLLAEGARTTLPAPKQPERVITPH